MKTRYSKLLFTFFLLSFKSFSQFKADESFTIKGSINLDKGSIQLVCKNPIDSAINAKPIKTYSAEITNGRFSIKGKLSFPAVYLFKYIKDDSCLYTSDYFLVDSGTQMAEISTKISMPKLLNTSMSKYYKGTFYKENQRFQKDIKWFQSFSDSLKAVYPSEIPDSLKNVLKLITTNQAEREEEIGWRFYEEMNDSYLSLWVLYDRLYTKGFHGVYDYYYSSLSDEIQQSYYGKLLKFKLNEANPTGIGAKFPLMYTYKNLKNDTLEKIPLKGDYTFIYVWWNRCTICIAQFPEFKKLYDIYTDKGFEIIHISCDNTNELPILQKIRKKHNVDWLEYLDENRENEKKLRLAVGYPKSFLVDKDGVIVKKNLSTKELQLFLEEKFN